MIAYFLTSSTLSSYAAYIFIWVLFLVVPQARAVVVCQFRYLPTSLRGSFWTGAACGTALVCVDAVLMVRVGSYAAAGAWHPAIGALTAAAVWAASVAITEEMIVRGLLLTRLRQLVRDWAAVSSTAMVFAIMHVGRADFAIPSVAQYFLDGLLLGWMVIVTGSIWPAAGFHFAKNLGVALLFGGSKRLVDPMLVALARGDAERLVPAMDFLAYAIVLPVCVLVFNARAMKGRDVA